ncbi:hypothetical protein RFI_34063 [Reticulomyxa filosa]|uniref:Uncharacterized protein n=1 Tax=Reticulomyxa filosa TaxID=46433 RepID=X6LQD9_RETFI|nr:hypothetical protein RFI_34063 [Reticulomyxa filosa]|eukprot:ETO03347.1 hypothetical protein RFI_34063 [Reticulomyxa filosa]
MLNFKIKYKTVKCVFIVECLQKYYIMLHIFHLVFFFLQITNLALPKVLCITRLQRERYYKFHCIQIYLLVDRDKCLQRQQLVFFFLKFLLTRLCERLNFPMDGKPIDKINFIDIHEQHEKEQDDENEETSSNLSAFSNVKNAVRRYKIRDYQTRAVVEAARNLYNEMSEKNVFSIFGKEKEDWSGAKFFGAVLGGSVQKGTAIADSYDGDLVFLLNIPQSVLRTAHHGIIEEIVYRPFFSRLATLIKQTAQDIPGGGYIVEREYTQGKTAYISIVWKNIQFDVLVAFHCISSQLTLWDIKIWENNIDEITKQLNEPKSQQTYCEIMNRIDTSDLTTKKLFQVNLSNWNSILSVRTLFKLDFLYCLYT